MEKITLLLASAFIMNSVSIANAQVANESQLLLPAVPVAAVPLKETYVTFPATSNNNIEYYAGTETYPYVYYSGYFWYPKAEANILTEYTPTYWNGYYWYASRIHPHQVYLEKQNALYLVPMEPTGILE